MSDERMTALAVGLAMSGLVHCSADPGTEEDTGIQAEAASLDSEGSGVFSIVAEEGGFGFVPKEAVVGVGETFQFLLGKGHTATEVDFETWLKSGTEALDGGFHVGLDAETGELSFDTQGVRYYVCLPHAEMGEKGQIRVE